MALLFRPGEYLGEEEATRRDNGISLVESRYSAATTMELHAHPTPLIHMVLAGTATDVSHQAHPTSAVGEVVYLPAGSPHATRWSAGGQGFALQLGARSVDALESLGILPSQPLFFGSSALTGWVVAARRELHRDGSAAIATEEILLELLTELSRRQVVSPNDAAPSRRLREVRDRVRDCCVGPPSLRELANDAGFHPVSLSRAFRRHFGETIGQCVRNRRLDVACQEIVAGNRSLTEIALQAGFADQSHFIRAFRGQFGMVPKEFLRQMHPNKKRAKS